MDRYIIASSKNWFLKNQKSKEFERLDIKYIDNKNNLTLEKIKKINPKYIFFTHWSWKIHSNIYQNFECIVFHTAPLPYGRGGSPIQNLILEKKEISPLYALKVSEDIDAGPIYCGTEVSLKGGLEIILKNIAIKIEDMILNICKDKPKPKPQFGNPHYFKRLSPKDNELKKYYSLDELYDHIRMVDAEDYQKSYIIFGNYKIEFSNSQLINENLFAEVKFSKLD